MDFVLLMYYSLAIVVASVVGGLLPDWITMTHKRTELAVSFVAGAMLGVALLHLLPHALANAGTGEGISTTVAFRWVLVGFLSMFFIERFFCFHHHDVAAEEGDESEGAAVHTCHEHDHPHSDHTPGLAWSGAAVGLTLHSLLAGVALGASVCHAPEGAWAAGMGVFFAIVLHKPFDAMTIAMLMERGGWSSIARSVVNGLFALVVPAGVALFYAGMSPLDAEGANVLISGAIAFSAGVFLCVSMSDLLPELHFHHHDRVKLSVALLLGLGVADIACRLESHSHAPPVEVPAVVEGAVLEMPSEAKSL